VRVLKGAYNRRLLLPRYSTTWEISIVTSHIAALNDNESLSLKWLSLKVVILALTRPSKSKDLSNLSLKAMNVYFLIAFSSTQSVYETVSSVQVT